jgi:uncharacterized protein (UPF0332 family)
MDARLFLRLAEALANDLTTRALVVPAMDPAVCRSVISRAYYAAFLVAQEFLDHIRVVVNRSPQAHVTVQYALNNSGDPTLVAVSSKLGKLQSERLNADYDLARLSSERPTQATSTLALAHQVIDQLDRLTAGTAGVPFDPVAAAATILNWAAVTGKSNVKRK